MSDLVLCGLCRLFFGGGSAGGTSDLTSPAGLCPLCLGVGDEIDSIGPRVETLLAANPVSSLSLSLTTPPVLDVTQRALRLVSQDDHQAEDQAQRRLPSLSSWLRQNIQARLGIPLVPDAAATIEVVVSDVASMDLFSQLVPDIRARKRKRQFSRLKHVNGEKTDDRGVSRPLADAALLSFKSYSGKDIAALKERMQCLSHPLGDDKSPLRMDVRLVRRSVFILGRYRKLARDVSQSQWTVPSLEDPTCRRGRASVEEILGEAARLVLQASATRFHACGREDIDVRMLGDGRLFVMEIVEPSQRIEEKHLSSLEEQINSYRGLNVSGDIEVLDLRITTADTWSSMQDVAEEKRKGYRAVVWSSTPVEGVKYGELESICLRDKDESNLPCLEIIQRTPLRVLHRRSLLSRKRFIYDIKVSPVNANFFLLDLVTSAGTYVKEFVHGDFGRTEPSVSSIMGFQCDILQLDVMKLYDDRTNYN